MADSSKRRERHPVNALTAVRVRKEQKPGRYADGNGLYLVVDPSGARRWLLRLVIEGRRRDLGLGSASLVPLSEAREKALAYRKTARQGGDPVRERKQASSLAPTFSKAAESVHKSRAPGFKNAKHSAQWISTLRTYANPTIGELRIDLIATPDIHRLIGPIWLAKPETARRVLQRIAAVFDWAKAAGYRSGENPVDGVKQGLAKQSSGKKHHNAMPFSEVPAFVANLRAADGFVASHLLLEFLVLTAVRTGEVLGAKWDEIDLVAAVWTIPAERMKAKREHRVPLIARSRLLSQRWSSPAKSKKAILLARAVVDDAALITSDEIIKRGAESVLVDLGKQIAENDVRSHRYLHVRIASIYQVAREAKLNPDVWSDLCRSPLFENAPRKPNSKRPDQALRFALMASRGTDTSGRKFASKWARQLKEHFEAEQPAATVLEAISRPNTRNGGSPSKPVKPKVYRYDLGVVQADCARHCMIPAGTKASVAVHSPDTNAIHALIVLLVKPSGSPVKKITPVKIQALSAHLVKYLEKCSAKRRFEKIPTVHRHNGAPRRGG
jgi:integrase